MHVIVFAKSNGITCFILILHSQIKCLSIFAGFDFNPTMTMFFESCYVKHDIR